MASQYINTLTSFSGADLIVSFANQIIGELQQISWAIQRETAPVFTLGSPDARSFSRGKRGIAGSLVFAMFDQDTLIESMKSVWNDIAPKAMFTAAGNVAVAGSEDFKNAMDLAAWNTAAEADMDSDYGYAGTSAISANKIAASNGDGQIYVPQGFTAIRGENVLYADTLPPFDACLTFANEFGQCAFQKIYDMSILNEGSGVSVDTIVMERQMTYVARRISPLTKGIYTRDSKGVVNANQN